MALWSCGAVALWSSGGARALSLPVLIIVHFYCSPRLQIMPGRELETWSPENGVRVNVNIKPSPAHSPLLLLRQCCQRHQLAINSGYGKPFSRRGRYANDGPCRSSPHPPPWRPPIAMPIPGGELQLYTFCVLLFHCLCLSHRSLPLPLLLLLLLLFSSLINFCVVL